MNALGFVPATVLAAALVTAVATPIVSRISLTLGVIDRPNERKVSRRDSMPLLGGLSVALGFFVGLSVALLLVADSEPVSTSLEALFVGGLMMLSLGAIDDRWGLSAFPKLFVQLAAAAVAIRFGFQIEHVTEPITHHVYSFPPWLVWVVTTAWIVLVTNSINLIDGLDGLATGVSAIIAVTLAVIAWQGGHLPGVMIGAALVGALVGFLPFNFPPARIFVGDTGALFIGYMLALLALEGYQRVTVITFIVPLLALAVPLLDTALSIVRRIRRGSHILKADRHHMHHRLLDLEGSHRPAVLSLYFLTACFCIIAVSFTRLHGIASIVFLAVVLVLTMRILRNLGFFEDGESPGRRADEGSAPGAMSPEVEGEQR